MHLEEAEWEQLKHTKLVLSTTLSLATNSSRKTSHSDLFSVLIRALKFEQLAHADCGTEFFGTGEQVLAAGDNSNMYVSLVELPPWIQYHYIQLDQSVSWTCVMRVMRQPSDRAWCMRQSCYRVTVFYRDATTQYHNRTTVMGGTLARSGWWARWLGEPKDSTKFEN